LTVAQGLNTLFALNIFERLSMHQACTGLGFEVFTLCNCSSKYMTNSLMKLGYFGKFYKL